MKRIAQSKQDLVVHLREQLGFIIKSSSAYDGGDDSEAKRIATSIRVLVHDTKKSKSLFSQLDLKQIGFLDTAVPIPANESGPVLALLQTKITVADELTLSGRHHPLLEHRPKDWPRAKKRFFADWWNQTILIDAEGRKFSRRLIVLEVADTDGGAHVDGELNADYVALSRHNSTGYAVGHDDVITPIDKAELATIRQIAHEILRSIADRRPDLLPSQPSYGFGTE